MSYRAYRAKGASLAAMKKIYKMDTDAFTRARKLESGLGDGYMVEWRDHKAVGVRIDWQPLNTSRNNFKWAVQPRKRPPGWVDNPDYPGVVMPPPGSNEAAEMAKMKLGDLRKEKAICPNGPTIVVNNFEKATYPRAYAEYPWVFTGRNEDEFFICVPEDHNGNVTAPKDAVELTAEEHAREAQHWGGFRDPEWMERSHGAPLPPDYPVKAPDTSKHNRRYFKPAGQSLALLQMLESEKRTYEQMLEDFKRDHGFRLSPETDEHGNIIGFPADDAARPGPGWKKETRVNSGFGNSVSEILVPDTATQAGRILADELAMIGKRPDMKDYPELCGNSENGPYARELDGELYMEVYLNKDGSHHTPPGAIEVPIPDYLELLQDVLDREQRHITPPPKFDKSRLPKPKPGKGPKMTP